MIYNSSAIAAITSVGDISSSIPFFKGGDAVVLWKNDVIIDIIGDISGVDIGTSWPAGLGSTAEYTIVRDSSVLSPNTEYTSSEWIAYPQDTSSYLGSHNVTYN